MKLSVLLSVALALCVQLAWAQAPKIGYTNMELVISLMPEYKQVETTLRTHERKLMEQVQVKIQYLEGKMQEYQEMMEKNALSEAQANEKRAEVQKLDQEIQQFKADAETSLKKKTEELTEPLITKFSDAIDKLTVQEGYTYIFNSHTAGTSIILKGPKEDNVTIKVLKILSIPVPKELEEQINGKK